MLVLSRKKGESIQIAENISITVSDVRGGRVRLSIDAPRSVRIVRGEIAFDVHPSGATTELEIDNQSETPELTPAALR